MGSRGLSCGWRTTICGMQLQFAISLAESYIRKIGKPVKILQSAQSYPVEKPMTTIDIFVSLVFRWGFHMLPTSFLKNKLAWTLAFVSISWCSAPCLGQDETLQDSNAKAQGSVFERLFGKSTSSPPETKKPKPKVQATPTSGKPNRSGFLVPLRSFSRSFRGSVESEESEPVQENSSKASTQGRIPREPFRNLPRVQELRERDNIDLQVEQLSQEYARSTERTSQTKSAPIVTPESITSNSAISANSRASSFKPSTAKTSTAKPVVAGSSKSTTSEILIETNSTSRRTAMDIEADEKSNTNRFVEKSTDNSKTKKTMQATSTSKATAEPKALIDLGFAADKSPRNLIASASRETANNQSTAKPYADDRSQPQGNAIQKTTPPANLPKTETKSAASEPRESPKSSLPIAPVATASLRREMSVPGVRVTVSGPNSMLVNDPCRFEVIARNEGSEVLNGLIVRIAVPTHVSVSDVAVTDGAALPENDQDGNTIIWELGQIPAGSSKTAVVSLKTPKPEHFALGVEWTVLPQSTEMQIAVQQPQLAIALEGPAEVVYGKPQLYRIRVRNTGNADVKGVSVAMIAEPYGSNQSDIGDINAGSERIVEVELTFQQTGTLPIVATATSETSKVDARAAIDVQVRQSELVANWYGPAEFYQGSVVDYELELSNVGAVAAVGTNCHVKIPAGAEIVSMPSGATRSGDSIKWDIVKIEPNEKVNVPLRLCLSKMGDNQLDFTGTCTSSNEVKAEFKTYIDAIADLHLTVVDPVAPAPVGQPVIYEVIIANRGKKSASDIEVIAQFSEGIEPIRLDGHTGRIVPGQAIFNTIPQIGANEKLVLRIHAEASKPGVHRFRVEVKSKGSDTDLLEEESTRYLATSFKGDRR